MASVRMVDRRSFPECLAVAGRGEEMLQAVAPLGAEIRVDTQHLGGAESGTVERRDQAPVIDVVARSMKLLRRPAVQAVIVAVGCSSRAQLRGCPGSPRRQSESGMSWTA